MQPSTRGAREAGRDPGDVLRIAQVVGTITPENVANGTDLVGDRPLRGSVDQWVTLLSELATNTPFRGFVLWPETLTLDQVNLFAHEVAPAVRGG
ncbi:hypothetical protein [Kribbella ginsengisoli]|uniref:Uncharacterized protein n=1 Tax=Kribbella ginsengisoli TaxID=363865 RepID=A0ABP6YLP4_9ACTN